ncbi:hypothetical protein [Pedobacter gandavensis]|uniref:hypothetical protein n=1 Tax=Pedobacter gandavensis TaxID=2679963 RepID=UPI00292DDC2B|nr:hypothetical protein [Pedobacter gandavensis]
MDNEERKQQIITDLFNKETIQKVTEATMIRCGLNLETDLKADIVAETFYQLSKMKAEKLIEIAETSNNYLERYSINISKNVGIRRSKIKLDKEGNEKITVSRQKMVEYLGFASSLNSIDVIDALETFDDGFKLDEISTNYILEEKEDDNSYQLLFEKIRNSLNNDEMERLELLLNKKHKKSNIEKAFYNYIVEKVKITNEGKLPELEQKIYSATLEVIEALYKIINKK